MEVEDEVWNRQCDLINKYNMEFFDWKHPVCFVEWDVEPISLSYLSQIMCSLNYRKEILQMTI